MVGGPPSAFVQWGGAPRREALLHHRLHCTRLHSRSASRWRRLSKPQRRGSRALPGRPASRAAARRAGATSGCGLGSGRGRRLVSRRPRGARRSGAGCGGARCAGPGEAGTGRQPLRFGGGGGEGRGQTVGGEAGEGRGGKSPERRTETFALSAGGQEKHPRRLIRGDGIRWGSLASRSGG